MSSTSISDQSTQRKKKRIQADSSSGADVTAIRTISDSYPIYYEAKENLISKQVPQSF
jgi:hypothetical protein